MNLDALIAKYNGKVINDFGGQCVALIAHYCIDNGKPFAYADAKDWWNHPALTGAFTFELNRPTDYNQVPQRGDIMIWSAATPGSGGAGHIGVYDAKVSPGIFRGFDNNWGGRYCHFVNHDYTNVIGWARPKAPAAPAPTTPQGGEMIATTDEAVKIYKMLRPNGSAAPAEIAGTAGKRTYKQFAIDAQPEIANRDASLKAQNAQLTNMQSTINQQNQTLTAMIRARDEAITSGSKTKAELVALLAKEQTELAKLAQLTADLETAHDTIKDLQVEAKPINEQVVVRNWLINLWNKLTKKSV